MYQFKNIKTGQVFSYKTLNAAHRAKDRIDSAYGAVCTSYPLFVEVI